MTTVKQFPLTDKQLAELRRALYKLHTVRKLIDTSRMIDHGDPDNEGTLESIDDIVARVIDVLDVTLIALDGDEELAE